MKYFVKLGKNIWKSIEEFPLAEKINICIFFALVIHGVFFWHQEKTLERSVDIASRSFSYTDRPYLSKKALTISCLDTIHNKFCFSAFIKNSGRTPALNVKTTYIMVRRYSNQIMPEPDLSKVIPTDVGSQSFLASGDTIQIDTVFQPISAKDIDFIKRDMFTIIYVGKATYRSYQDTGEHYIRFCQYFYPKMGKANPDLFGCPYFNDGN